MITFSLQRERGNPGGRRSRISAPQGLVAGQSYAPVMGYDRGSGEYRDGKPVRFSDVWQKVLNESWPERYPNGVGHARNVETQRAEKCIAVTVRIVCEENGEEFKDGIAERWTSTHVGLNDSGMRQSRVPCSRHPGSNQKPVATRLLAMHAVPSSSESSDFQLNLSRGVSVSRESARRPHEA